MRGVLSIGRDAVSGRTGQVRGRSLIVPRAIHRDKMLMGRVSTSTVTNMSELLCVHQARTHTKGGRGDKCAFVCTRECESASM